MGTSRTSIPQARQAMRGRRKEEGKLQTWRKNSERIERGQQSKPRNVSEKGLGFGRTCLGLAQGSAAGTAERGTFTWGPGTDAGGQRRAAALGEPQPASQDFKQPGASEGFGACLLLKTGCADFKNRPL